jgi:hypothetical protein
MGSYNKVALPLLGIRTDDFAPYHLTHSLHTGEGNCVDVNSGGITYETRRTVLLVRRF